jgi:hypothetical protein
MACCSMSARIAAAASSLPPIRPATEWRPRQSLAKRPASTKPVHLSYDREEVARFAKKVRDIPPESR